MCNAIYGATVGIPTFMRKTEEMQTQGMRSNIAKRQTSLWNSKGMLALAWLNQAKSPFAPASCL